MINLTSIHLGANNIFGTARKAEALAEAKRLGFSPASVSRAFNRFNIFWVIAYAIQPAEGFGLLTRDGGWAEFRGVGHADPLRANRAA